MSDIFKYTVKLVFSDGRTVHYNTNRLPDEWKDFEPFYGEGGESIYVNIAQVDIAMFGPWKLDGLTLSQILAADPQTLSDRQRDLYQQIRNKED